MTTPAMLDLKNCRSLPMFRQLLILETGSLTRFHYIPETTSALQHTVLSKRRFIDKLKEILDIYV